MLQAQELTNSSYIIPKCKVFGIVYALVNMKNNKTYVGQHGGDSKSIWTRWRKDLRRGHNSHLNNAVKQYNAAAFRGEILAYCHSREEMNNLERL